jgi:ribosomal protein S18 acetylase RimI-like enzyme
MTRIHVRPFVPGPDNAAVLEVARTLSIPARVHLGIDRSPDYMAFSQAVSEPCEIVVAEAGGEIVGFVEFCPGHFRVFGTASVGVHVPLGGVRPEWRRRGVSTALAIEGARRARLAGAEWACVLVNARNRPMQDNLRRFVPGTIVLNHLLVHGILARWTPEWRGKASRYSVEPVDESGWSELLDFIGERIHQHDVFPETDAAKLGTLPYCPKESYRVARDSSGRVVASLGSWDASPFKRVLVLGYGRLEDVLLGPINRLLRLTGTQPFPRPGEALRTLYALCPLAAPGHEAALGRLIAGLRRERRDCSAILIAFPAGDPRNRVVRSFSRFTNVNLPFLIPLTAEFGALLRSQPPRSLYIEYAFL